MVNGNADVDRLATCARNATPTVSVCCVLPTNLEIFGSCV